MTNLKANDSNNRTNTCSNSVGINAKNNNDDDILNYNNDSGTNSTNNYNNYNNDKNNRNNN